MVDKVSIGMNSDGSTEEEQQTHDEKMAKVAEENAGTISATDKEGNETTITTGQEPADKGVAQRPDDIPEKFWDAEKGEVNVPALLKSQQDAEAALRSNQQEKPEDKPEGDSKDKPEEGTTQDTVVAKASEEYAANGQLSDETYDSLAKAGLDKGMVDTYIEGQRAVVQQLENAAGEPFGGMEGYNKAADWAAENLSTDEIQALDIQLTSTNPAIVKQGATALQSKYAANADITPDVTLSGQGSPGSSGGAFRSSAEMQAAMSDPRYKTDVAFRNEVASKIERSNANLFS